MFVAPEVVLKTGYREAVDWWSMGVVLYELLFGKRPFKGHDSKELAENIVQTPLQFPETSKEYSGECCEFIGSVPPFFKVPYRFSY